MENKIIKVYIFSDENKIENITTTKLFSDKSSDGLVSASINILNPVVNDYDSDYFLTYTALISSNPEDYVVICKDTAISSSSSQTIFDFMQTIINKNISDSNNSFDICYMGKWMDRCNQYTNITDVNSSGLKTANTISPNGILCLMFSPEGRAKFLEIYNINTNPIPVQTAINNQSLGHHLNGKIGLKTSFSNSKKFYAITTIPSIINFDITKRKSDDEFIKTVECRNIQKETKNTDVNNSNMMFFWFIIIILIVIFFVWIIFKYSSYNKIENPIIYVKQPVT